ncbi:putative bifunctional diguanylate cyclase/phosphodiesterase [Novosphingobium sp. B 225]|uniref:putative bifunctional diguanylate cyclase/phosphodiesterase n=1 Tax=Novosphingobium sp. B 225 TaxID=1961849 RepID=UPI00159547EB|nr:EAL domain-containing protein [Novosphingobium sp. B 225]
MISQQAPRGAVPAHLQDWVDRRLVNTHVRIVRMMVLGTLLNACAMLLVLFGEVATAQLTLFAASTALAGFHRLWIADPTGPHRDRVHRQRRDFRWNAWWMGLNLGVPLALWLPHVPPGAQLLLAVCGIAQLASAAYTMRTLPLSATAWIALQTLGLAVGLAWIGSAPTTIAVLVLIAAAGMLIRMAFISHHLFIARLLADRELATSNWTVQVLLNEYEQTGSDWLYELDREGRLINVTARFADRAGRAIDALEGQPFAALFGADAIRDTLTGALTSRRPLHGAILALANPGGTVQRWWSVSGRPSQAAGGGRVAWRGLISDVTDHRMAERRAQQMAHFDALTGLPNRTLFDRTLGELVEERGPDEAVALLHLDIDHFKAVNDEFGHPAGDAYLRMFANRLTAALEASGLGGARRMVARLGGDEFAIALVGNDACDHAARLAGVLVETMAQPYALDDLDIAGGVSAGLALAPLHADDKQQLFSYADMALTRAKRDGRGTWEMFEPGMDEALHERHALARDLRHAVSRGELRLFLQPLIDVPSEAKTGYEALLRWQHPERGLVPPDQFIPIAEETGLIVPVGEWVIRTAFEEAARWPGGETISINLSPLQLSSPNLMPLIVHALAETGIDPARVEFEITEGVLLNNSEANIALLGKLHDLGVKIALDDFGTGYASLNYLLTFPFDKIKIDRRFVNELETREESRAIVAAVIALANQLGMCTLAEGVEQPEQLAQLRRDGCRMVQGWLFGKAQPSEHYHPRAALPPAAPAARLPRARRTAPLPPRAARRSSGR